ncbi:hypothetical protein AAG570_000978 [Ranatra chinensis]|uniref:Uncharacterized protein n=1 Tax=Ranatra chinensis TaxID=642074 RepID=A0ABD0YYP5_9HEMI
MQGARRVITFCLLIGVLPMILLIIPLYLRHSVYRDVVYAVAESDILQIVNGISSVFCQEHTLQMNTTFNAFQIKGPPQISQTVRKHVRLKKSMSLPDDTLEYWGFFLPAGSTVLMHVCSRYDGSRILVVKGEKNLRQCGLMQPPKTGGAMAKGQGQVYVKFESPMPKRPNLPQEHEYEEKRYAEYIPSHKLDGGYAHGEKVFNYTSKPGNDSSISSFENSLLTCYDGQILLSRGFQPSKYCNSTTYLEKGNHMNAIHNVTSDGYYYYIFYSDNDHVLNDIHAIFNIHKPTYQYGNFSHDCINKTECSFPINFMSDEIVIVEVPTKDGIEDRDDFSLLISKCHPRSTIYAIFPLTVLFLILACSFL